ncbi:MAG: hypothetical protein JWL75_371 [Parcubacteria group bacterium]|nr:hypothetical protein [Parcubacteria group bacterium]
MHIEHENLHYEAPKFFYWTRVHLTFEDGSKAAVLVGAGRNYISDHFKVPGDVGLKQSHVHRWLQEALVEIAASIFDASQPVYYKIYSLSDEGQVNGLKFLMEDVTP